MSLSEEVSIYFQIPRYSVANVDIEKYLQAVQALNRARAIDENHPELHVRLVHFKKTGSCLVTSYVTPTADFGDDDSLFSPTATPSTYWTRSVADYLAVAPR